MASSSHPTKPENGAEAPAEEVEAAEVTVNSAEVADDDGGGDEPVPVDPSDEGAEVGDAGAKKKETKGKKAKGEHTIKS
jgi:hypothetical protein